MVYAEGWETEGVRLYMLLQQGSAVTWEAGCSLCPSLSLLLAFPLSSVKQEPVSSGAVRHWQRPTTRGGAHAVGGRSSSHLYPYLCKGQISLCIGFLLSYPTLCPEFGAEWRSPALHKEIAYSAPSSKPKSSAGVLGVWGFNLRVK